MELDDSVAEEVPPPPSTTPSNLAVRLVGFDDPSIENDIEPQFREIFVDHGRIFDLSRLDGVTIAQDYRQALLDLDRGYKTDFKLKPSESYGQGVAMTPSVLRDGVLKSHILLDAQILFGMLRDKKGPEANHLIAHECAHVEITKQFDESFPGVLLRPQVLDIRSHCRWQIILVCWDEYAACMRSAKIGAARADRYRESFLLALKHMRDQANESIKKYRLHADLNLVVAEVSECYLALMKYASYHLGNLNGLGIPWREDAETIAALEDHWFLHYLERTDQACIEIDGARGAWTDKAQFERLGDVGEDLIAAGGLHFIKMPNGEMRIDIPFSLETTPD